MKSSNESETDSTYEKYDGIYEEYGANDAERVKNDSIYEEYDGIYEKYKKSNHQKGKENRRLNYSLTFKPANQNRL